MPVIIEEPSCRAAHHAELSDIWERSVRATHHWFDEADIRLLKATLPAHIDAFAHLLSFLSNSSCSVLRMGL